MTMVSIVFFLLLAFSHADASLHRSLFNVSSLMESLMEEQSSPCLLSDDCSDPCVWCSAGSLGGLCVSQNTADAVVAVLPHIECGADDDKVDNGDQEYFENLEDCLMMGVTGNDCLALASDCSWCVTKDEPQVGFCLFQGFVDENHDMSGDDFDEIFSCTKDAHEDQSLLQVGALADVSCALNGNPQDLMLTGASESVQETCSAVRDAADQPCVTVSLLGFFDACMTATQQAIVEPFMDQMGELGVDNPLALLGGGFGGDGPVIEGGLFGDDDQALLEDESMEDDEIKEAIEMGGVEFDEEDYDKDIAEDVEEEEEEDEFDEEDSG